MSNSDNPLPDPGLVSLIAQALTKHACYADGAFARWLLVDVAGQRLVLLCDRTPQRIWPVSTAAAGRDNRQGSGGTPTGAHRVAEKIGTGAVPGAIFSSRRDTNRVWPADQPDDRRDDLILTRILTLAGCEPGLNQGPGVDSHARYIYLHGTNHEDRLGEPVSHGCVRLSNADILTVFDLVREGDPVVII